MFDAAKAREHYSVLNGIAADYEMWATASEGEEQSENEAIHRIISRCANKVKASIQERLFNEAT